MCVCARSNAWTTCEQDFTAAASKHHKAPTQICHRSRKPSSTKQSVHLNEHREVRDGMLFFLFCLRCPSPVESPGAASGETKKGKTETTKQRTKQKRKRTNKKGKEHTTDSKRKTKQNEPNKQNERTNKQIEAQRKQRTNERRPRRLRRKPPARLSAGGVRASPRSRPPPGPP